MKRFVSTRGWVVFLAVLLLPAMMLGQEVTGSIAGTVFDSSGAALPGASLEVAGPNLVRPLTSTSDSTGNYTFPSVPAGTYTVTATANGFTSMKQTGINVVLGRTARLEFKLTVGAVAETVTVTGDAVMVDTSSSASAVTVDRTFFDQLPKGRGFYDLISLAPGARNESKSRRISGRRRLGFREHVLPRRHGSYQRPDRRAEHPKPGSGRGGSAGPG